ncbi:probable GUP1 - Multimembrane-spanning protein essential for proton symport of glycerol [Melanopsichium pennsylvanicum]|uniref:Probable GUP1 - Multimembrane-spanning protein essential for proton symport of glycerol n=2 Tax=Melanopsichium pennsylvanicum TaxID=63383 RepID=A0AAJ4XRP6_9BASI|nr:probable GUP1-Multimembrane-spanning protein essential for proton symport of glycerol [Melanopsichium pennsylvanicum 4]SNX87280.1 probable GUP1 - Multimembrane-spanning protein essential for proton symport of glycerol [Melanopsichium pennsylvanicum]
MLPTHFASPDLTSQHADDMTAATNKGLNMHQGVITAYPPSASFSGARAVQRAPSNPTVKRVLRSRGIASLTIDTGPLSGQALIENEITATTSSTVTTNAKVKRGRWHTLEFKFYYLVFLVMVPLMVYVPIRLSTPTNPNYYSYSDHLKPGWIGGRSRDDSDFQYRSFRDYVPALVGIMGLYLVLSKAFTLLPRSSSSNRYTRIGGTRAATSPKPNRIPFLTVFSAIFIFALHGFNSLKLLLILATNYGLAKALGGTRIAPVVFFSFNISMLFAVHWNDGFEYSHMSPTLSFLEVFKGLLPRWQINFNITMLRLVSFAMDYHWAKVEANAGGQAGRAIGEVERESREATYQERTRLSQHLEEYNVSTYLLYVLYPPLFIAGPIMTFNDFTHQLRLPIRIAPRPVVMYAIRFVVSLMTMELILHYIYVNAIKDTKAWVGASPLELSMVGFWNLIIVWLKLLIPWRFFRLWAMADGVEAPENMVRCMANNYSTLGFWRSWHRSYNLWIVRYIYVPLGGSKNQIPSTLLVFTFVALWHDLSLRLLAWGWMITFFIVPEVAARKMLPYREYGNEWWYRHVAAVGGVGNVLMMMTGNLVGFVVGTDGMKYMVEQLLGSTEGFKFMAGACATLFVGVQVMFEYREEELRRGIDRKC